MHKLDPIGKGVVVFENVVNVPAALTAYPFGVGQVFNLFMDNKPEVFEVSVCIV